MAPDLDFDLDVDLDQAETQMRLIKDDVRHVLSELLEEIVNPGVFEERAKGVTRGGQVLAFLFVGPVIMVSLQLIVVLNELMTEILGVKPLGAGQDPIFAWLVTALTGGAYVMFAWLWFQFVKTGAFGWFTWDDIDAGRT
jgi:hypothetical protein